MDTDPSRDDPLFPLSDIPFLSEQNYNHVRRRILRRYRALQATALLGVGALAAAVAVAPSAALQGWLLISEGILVLVLVISRWQSARDGDAIAYGVGVAVVQRVRRRRRVMALICGISGVIAGTILAWVLQGN